MAGKYRLNTRFSTNSQFYNLVVCGGLEKKRWDYDLVFDLVIEAEEKQLPGQITLSGGTYEYTIPKVREKNPSLFA
ncbi:hypothetical protein [Niastella vici]|uniref:hypothetical protein n=1 Tax=Niastella vici TaxID=1703345 RepID=UPI00117CA38F|nr:hypothetical protein [Niastella vici]